MDSAAAVRAPTVNPFRGTSTLGKDALPRGERVALLLGHGSNGPFGRRVVAGEVAGFEPSDSTHLIVALRRVTTWMFDEVPEDVEPLPPEYRAILVVEAQDSLRDTIQRIRDGGRDGRAVLPAIEMPHARCPACGVATQRVAPVVAAPFCGACGHRIGLGALHLRPAVPPAAPGYCEGCWHPDPGQGAFCVHCGTERAIARDAARLAGQAIRFLVTARRRRLGRYTATVRRAVFRRHTRDAGPQVLLQVEAIRPVRGSEAGGPQATWLAVSAENGRARAVFDAIERGREVRVTEPLRRCPHCVTRTAASGTVPGLIRSLFCTRCGTRVRLTPTGNAAGGAASCSVCDASLGIRDRFCGACGTKPPARPLEVTSLARGRFGAAPIEGDAFEVAAVLPTAGRFSG